MFYKYFVWQTEDHFLFVHSLNSFYENLFQHVLKCKGLWQTSRSGTNSFGEDPEVARRKENFAGENHGTSESNRPAGQREERNAERCCETWERQERTSEDTGQSEYFSFIKLVGDKRKILTKQYNV